jgi:hypothetical protein
MLYAPPGRTLVHMMQMINKNVCAGRAICIHFPTSPGPSFSSANREEKHCIRIPVAFRLYLVKIIQILTNQV